MENTILHIRTEYNGNFIGTHQLKWCEVIKITKSMIINSLRNFFKLEKSHITIWAIDDNDKNYDIFVQKKYE